MVKNKILALFAICLMLVGCSVSPINSSTISQDPEINIPIDISTGDTSTTGETGGADIDKDLDKDTPVVDSMWPVDFKLSGNAFKKALATLINNKRTKYSTYKNCLSVGAAATTISGSKFVPFYHDKDTLTTTSNCNREHTWPKSRGTKNTNAEKDPFVIRPTLTSDNSSRANYFYGLGLRGANEWDPASCGFEGARGEAARVILYCATAYYSLGFELSNNPADSTSKKTMGTLKYLIEWNMTYEVTEIEIKFNDYMYKNGYGRNPFVDHPEYANYIWDSAGYIV